MSELGMSKADLARALGVTDATTTDLFKPENKSSRLVPDVHAAIGWDPPPPPESAAAEQAERDALKAEIDTSWPLLSEEERQAVLAIVRIARRHPRR